MVSMRDIRDLVIANARTPFEKREFLLRNDRKKFVVARPSSMLIGGPTGSCKSVVASYISCWIVMMDGLILLVDPHCNNPDRGLRVVIDPLRDWFLREPVDFTSKEKVLEQFEWAESELIRRELPGGLIPQTKLIFLVIDEFNEFMNRLSKAEKTRVCTIIGNIARSGAKWGINCILIGHNWDLSKTGSVRYDVVTRICTGGEYRQMSMVLDNDDKQLLKDLWSPPITKGTALVRRSDYSLHKMSFPNVTRYGCEAIANLVKNARTPYAVTSEELVENMQYGHEGSSPKLTEAHVHNMQQQSSPYKTGTLTTDFGEKGISGKSVSGEQFHTSIEPFMRRDGDFPLTNSLTSALPPEPLHFPTLVQAPRANNVSEEDRQLIIRAGNQQLAETGKVIRTKILSDLRESTGDLRWNNKALWKVTAICDEMNWNARMSPRQLSTAEKQTLRQQAGKCASCGAQDVPLEVDHRWPKSLGGTLEPGNIQILCRGCNQKKGARV